jgi:3-phosphoshikimate 1-carboxyvinyltransferase
MEQIEIHKSKSLRGSFSLQGDTFLNCHAIFLSTQAQGHSKLENVPCSQWFDDLLETYSTLGFPCTRESSTVNIQGGTKDLIALDFPLRPKHEIILMSLGGLFAALKSHNLLNIDFKYMPKSSLTAFLDIFECESLQLNQDTSPSYRVLGIKPDPGKNTSDEFLIKTGRLYYQACIRAGLNIHFQNSGNDHLEKMLALFGADIKYQRSGQKEMSELEKRMARKLKQPEKSIQNVILPDSFELRTQSARLPNDFSLASVYVLAANVIPGSEIILENVVINPSRTGFFSALRRMGATVEVMNRKEMSGETSGTIKAKYTELKGRTFHSETLKGMREEIPLLIIAGALAEGETIIRNIDFLRSYDRDLLKQMIKTLKAMNVKVGEIEDGLVIKGSSEYDAHTFSSFNHPMVGLAFLVMGLKCHGKSVLKDTACIQYQYPGTIENLIKLAQS